MGRPKIFQSEAEKQRVYRARRKAAATTQEKLHYARLQALHDIVQCAALDGDERAAEMLGKNPSDTALKIILLTQPAPIVDDEAFADWDLRGFDIALYAYEEAASSVLLEKTELKDGVFQLVIGTEPRQSRQRQSIADRPAASRSAKRHVTDKARTPRAKRPLTVARKPPQH
jgi:hypothetical protein